MCVEGVAINRIRDSYQDIIDRCEEVLNWKNEHDECVFNVGGVFDTKSPLFIVCFNEKGVLVTNNNQSALVTYSELESDSYQEDCVSSTLSIRNLFKEGKLNV